MIGMEVNSRSKRLVSRLPCVQAEDQAAEETQAYGKDEVYRHGGLPGRRELSARKQLPIDFPEELVLFNFLRIAGTAS